MEKEGPTKSPSSSSAQPRSSTDSAKKEPDPYPSQLRISLGGDEGAGKTCLLSRFIDDVFPDDASQYASSGVDFRGKTIQLIDHNDASITIQVWDILGAHERLRPNTQPWCSKMNAVIIVYDITDQVSFNNTRQWLQECDRYAPNMTCRMLVGNKLDLSEKRVVDTAAGQECADSFGCSFIETSAKDATNVETLFVKLISQYIKQWKADNAAEASRKGSSTARIIVPQDDKSKEEACLLS